MFLHILVEGEETACASSGLTPDTENETASRQFCRQVEIENYTDRRHARAPEIVPPPAIALRKAYRLYKKIANTTRATVMTHRMTLLLPFFSSAIDGQQHTRNRD
jgi:hypothetical protein